MLAVDIEAYDPNLKDLGDGSFRKDGFVVCVGIYDGSQFYYFVNMATDGTYKWNDNRIYDMLKSNEPRRLQIEPHCGKVTIFRSCGNGAVPAKYTKV